MPIEFTQVNINLTNQDTEHVDEMMAEDGLDNRSAFMRKLVRNEWKNRHPQAVPAAECTETSNE